MAVHKAVLEGFGYKFNAGIGTYIINYYKIDNPTKKTIDFQVFPCPFKILFFLGCPINFYGTPSFFRFLLKTLSLCSIIIYVHILKHAVY